MSVTDRDLGYGAILRLIEEMGEQHVVAGIRQEDGAKVSEEDGYTVAEYATVNEYGSQDGRVPERSFMRSAFDENLPKLEKRFETEMVKVLDGKQSLRQGLARVGEDAVGRVQRKLRDGPFVPNAPRTIAWKKSSKPLHGKSGLLGGSISHEVREGA